MKMIYKKSDIEKKPEQHQLGGSEKVNCRRSNRERVLYTDGRIGEDEKELSQERNSMGNGDKISEFMASIT